MHCSPYRWAIAVAAFMAAFLIRYAVHDVLPAGFPFLTFFPAVILTAFLGGALPGACVAVASTLASWFFFIERQTFDLNASTALALGFFVLIAVVDLLVIHFMFKWMTDLDEERQRSRELAASRDLLFKEMQHRISNNLAFVGAMLRMQQRTVDDEVAVRALKEAAGRLTLMAKIQRRLHDPDVQHLSFHLFLKELCSDIVSSSAAGDDIECSVCGDEVLLHSDQAVPLALIAAELTANALEHAFLKAANKTIMVELRQKDQNLHLTVQDSGDGVPDGFDLTKVRSLGLTVATRLAQQLGGSLTVSNHPGARFELSFPSMVR
jgi:two-component sensor histidine kinase